MTKPAPGPDQPPIPVRLVTLTLSPSAGPGDRLDLPRLAALLASADADVVCLQDVERSAGGRSGDVDPALELSRVLDLQLARDPAVQGAGHALLSRLPLLVSDVHPLPGGGTAIALRTMIELDGGALWVTSTHLTTGSADDRAAQVAAVTALHADAMETGVVVGDLGGAPDDASLGPLQARFSDARGVAYAVDQVWVTPGIAVAAARVLEDAGHRPLVVDLLVPSGV